jgi:uncharacterized delta-60 repeat protein
MQYIVRYSMIICLLFVQAAYAQTLDPAFSPGTGFGGMVYAITSHPSGKAIVGGGFSVYNGSTVGNIVLLDATGNRDTSFKATANGVVTSICVLRDQRILVGGAFNMVNGQPRNKLVCLASDGTIDPLFHYSTGFSGGTQNVQTITEQADGKILVGGEFMQYDMTSAGHIIRLNADGTIDSSFNSTAGANGTGIFKAISQPDGKVLVAGSFTTYNNMTAGNFARLNADGSLDNTFLCNPGASLLTRAMALQADGKVIIGGSFLTVNGRSVTRFARLDTSGTVDTTFLTGAGPASAQPNTVEIHPSGKIMVGGAFTTYDNIASRRLAVLNTDGTIDNTFLIGAGFSGSGSVSAIHCTPDGKVWVGGLFSGFDGTASANIARFTNAAPLPVSLTTFNAAVRNNEVALRWSTASEMNNLGFTIERKMAAEWEAIGFVQGKGTSNQPQQYIYTDNYHKGLTVYYRLKQQDHDGALGYSDIVAVKGNNPAAVSACPNPFAGMISLSDVADVELYDMHGYRVLKADHVQHLATDHVPSGMYMLKISAGDEVSFRKLIK